MGEVYRARDTKLGRDVALKLLTEEFVREPDRMARFEREAKFLASLNHPNIASIYGFEDSGNTRALVMEFVEGPTLADRIKQGAIAMDKALLVAKQICEALEYAHERGIIHRDLKPANIKLASNDKLTNNNVVKVLDFGLAKAIQGDTSTTDVSSSPAISTMATHAGIILGTAAYMSPQQAQSKPIDQRTDIWAFGCVFYEMLTGQTPFHGETLTDTLAAVLKEDPDWSRLPATTQPQVRELLQRCLKKEVKLEIASHWRRTHRAARGRLRRTAGQLVRSRRAASETAARLVALGCYCPAVRHSRADRVLVFPRHGSSGRAGALPNSHACDQSLVHAFARWPSPGLHCPWCGWAQSHMDSCIGCAGSAPTAGHRERFSATGLLVPGQPADRVSSRKYAEENRPYGRTSARYLRNPGPGVGRFLEPERHHHFRHGPGRHHAGCGGWGRSHPADDCGGTQPGPRISVFSARRAAFCLSARVGKPRGFPWLTRHQT